MSSPKRADPIGFELVFAAERTTTNGDAWPVQAGHEFLARQTGVAVHSPLGKFAASIDYELPGGSRFGHLNSVNRKERIEHGLVKQLIELAIVNAFAMLNRRVQKLDNTNAAFFPKT